MLVSSFTKAVALGVFAAALAVPSFAEIVSGAGTGATVTTVSLGPANFAGFLANPYAATVISDQITSATSSIDFTYGDPPNYSTGDRLILEVTNNTGSTLTNLVFTLTGLSGPQYYINAGTPGIPSSGVYDSGTNTYTTNTSLVGDLSGPSVLNVPLTLGVGQEQDFYFAVNYTSDPGNFTLSQKAAVVGTPEPGVYSVYGSFVVGLFGMLVALRRRKIAVF